MYFHLKPKAVWFTPLQQELIEVLAEEGLPRCKAASTQVSNSAIKLSCKSNCATFLPLASAAFCLVVIKLSVSGLYTGGFIPNSLDFISLSITRPGSQPLDSHQSMKDKTSSFHS